MTVNSADCSILIPTGLIDGDDELIQYKLTGFIGIGNQFDMESPTNLGGPRATNYRIGTAGNIPVISKVLTVALSEQEFIMEGLKNLSKNIVGDDIEAPL